MTQIVHKVPVDIKTEIENIRTKYDSELAKCLENWATVSPSNEYFAEMNAVLEKMLSDVYHPPEIASTFNWLIKKMSMPINQSKMPAIVKLMVKIDAFIRPHFENKTYDFNVDGELVTEERTEQ